MLGGLDHGSDVRHDAHNSLCAVRLSVEALACRDELTLQSAVAIRRGIEDELQRLHDLIDELTSAPARRVEAS